MSNDPEDRTYSIADLAHEFGVTARAIRFYEDKGLLSPRREGQRRIFTERDRVRLLLIVRGKRLGFSLSECQDIIDMYGAEPTEGAQLRRLIDTIRQRRESLLERMEDMRLTLDELDQVETQAQRILDGVNGEPAVAQGHTRPARETVVSACRAARR
ncbi:MerR family DNA-binding transcriptional regulator [uncultured Rhodospira sp.]|uniref:MerR family transcriptional regulator n=1 Tax=uncultured Rhodospira sp. TaxID=1936189 RepID=UPI00260325FC|nr:MerR family DNA-binding transcriptional regulator [uncultured Rhodospira sp.]